MKKNLFILHFLFSFSLFAQENKIDSLENLLEKEITHEKKINLLNKLSTAYLYINPNKSYFYGKQALDEYENYFKTKNNSDNNIKKEKTIALNNIGATFYLQGNYEKALDGFFNAQKIAEEIGDKPTLATSLNNIGLIYHDQLNYKKALEFYLKGLEINETLDNKLGMAIQLNNVGTIYKDEGELDKALEYFLKSDTIAKELGEKQGLVFGLTNIGNVYFAKKNMEKALEYFEEAVKIEKEISDMEGLATDYNNISMIYSEQKNYQKAIEYSEQSLRIAQKENLKDNIQAAFLNLSHIYEKTENYKFAYEYHRKYSEIKDSIFNEESSKQITEMQTKYETEKKELQIENLNKDNAIKETEIKKQNVQKIAFASGFLLTLILAFVIFRGYKQKQKVNEIISIQKTEVEKQKEIVEEKNKSLEIAYKHIEEKNTEILDSIRYAKRIQEAILPPQKLVKQYLENSFILYKPKDIVAGDFYWMHTPSPKERGQGGEVFFACCDCTGHGVPGAFVSILGYNGLNRCVKEFGLTKPSEILDKLCELVDEAFSKSEADIKDGMDIALVNLDLKGFGNLSGLSTLQYAGAGNSLYLVRKKTNEPQTVSELRTPNYELTEYSPDKQPIGKFAYRKPFTNHEIELQKGDVVYIFTDGYADQFGGVKGKKFKYSQFEKLLLSIQEKSMVEQREILNDAIDNWRGELEQVDDICIIGVRV